MSWQHTLRAASHALLALAGFLLVVLLVLLVLVLVVLVLLELLVLLLLDHRVGLRLRPSGQFRCCPLLLLLLFTLSPDVTESGTGGSRPHLAVSH